MEFLLIHLDDLAVVSHDSVDLDLHVGRLGVDGCAATLLDELLELLGEGGVLGKDFVTILGRWQKSYSQHQYEYSFIYA